MDSKSLVSTSKVLWYDSNVHNKENRGYIETLSKMGASLETFSSSDILVPFLKANSNRKYVIITSGRDGEKLIETIKTFENVIGMIVFCFDKKKHEKWASKFPKVKSVSTSIQEVAEQVKMLTEKYLLLGALELAEGSNYEIAKGVLEGKTQQGPLEGIEYYHFKSEKVMDFKLTSLLLKGTVSPPEVLEELIVFKTTPESEKQIKAIFKDIGKPSFNLLKAFCYLYSTDLIYSQFTQACASKSYTKVIKTIKATLEELKKQQTKIFKNKVLYRGVKKARVNVEDYRNKKGFWSSFTSTSQQEAIAKHFAGPGGVIFIITLSEKSIHPNVMVEKDWSYFPIEKEVLLFPYFPLITTSIEEKDGFIYINVKQNDSDSVLSLENDDLWPMKIELGIIIGMEEGFDDIYNNFCESMAIESIIGDKKFTQVVAEIIHEEVMETMAELMQSDPTIFFNPDNATERVLSNLNKDKINKKFEHRVPELIKQIVEEKISGLYEKTNTIIHKIITEEILWTANLHEQINVKLKEGINHLMEIWNHMVQEVDLSGYFKEFSKLLPEILRGMENLQDFMEPGKIESLITKIEVSGNSEEKTPLEIYKEAGNAINSKIEACNQELFKDFKEVLDGIKQKFKDTVKCLIYGST